MPVKLATRGRPRLRQHGLSIVEMLVGITVGLFVVAAAALLVGGQLSSNRLLLLDTQLQQDLRATADIISRELRRSGALQDSLVLTTLWTPDMAVSPAINAATQTLAPAAGATTEARFRYQREQGIGTFGFRLQGTRIQSRMGGSWQELTDSNVMEVTNFTVTAQNGPLAVVPCPNDCPGGGQACWPTVQTRQLQLVIDARSASDPSVTRSIRSNIRLRGDRVLRNAAVVNGICPPVP